MQEATLLVQAIATAVIALTLGVQFFQLRAMRKSEGIQNILYLVNFLQDQEVRNARSMVIKQLKEKSITDWNEEERKCASTVCSTYDLAGIFIRRGLVPLEPFADNWGPSIRKCYSILEPFIREMQKPENEGPQYWNDFPWLFQQVNQAQE